MNKTLFALCLALLPAAAAAQNAPVRIGVAGAVSGLVKATSPGTTARDIRSGSPLYLNDQVITDAKGKLQLMLLDETVSTVGPNSDLTLDEFVYDPSSDSGKVAAKVTKGAFRFVTGKVARKDPANMKVKLSVGTIGIRGTMVGGIATPESSQVMLLGPGGGNNAGENPGAIALSNGGAPVIVTQPGFGAVMLPDQPEIRLQDMSDLARQLSSQLAPAENGEQSGDNSTAEASGGEQEPSGESQGEGQAQPLNAGEAAGQETAAALGTQAAAAGLGQIMQALQNTSAEAAIKQAEEQLPALAERVSTWVELRSANTGVLRYSGSGTAPIYDSMMDRTDLCQIQFDIFVDFDNRTLGGGSSGIKLIAPGDSLLDSAGIRKTSFDSLSGNASMAFVYDEAADDGIDNNRFDNSVLSFLNSGGGTANKARLDLVYNDGMYASGAGTAQTGAPVNPLSTWEQVRTIEAGAVQYTGSGQATLSTISGSAGGYAGVYDVDFKMLVNFGARIYGGGTAADSSITMTHTVNQTTLATNINASNFANLGGPAAALLSTSNPAFAGSSASFFSSASSPASHLAVSVNYYDIPNNVSGGGLIVTGEAAAPPMPS
jgi:hypothetical protein